VPLGKTMTTYAFSLYSLQIKMVGLGVRQISTQRGVIVLNSLLKLIIINYTYGLICNKYILYNGLLNYT
jgi:hypothetical protein